jgi:hypothetical protein
MFANAIEVVFLFLERMERVRIREYLYYCANLRVRE